MDTRPVAVLDTNSSPQDSVPVLRRLKNGSTVVVRKPQSIANYETYFRGGGWPFISNTMEVQHGQTEPEVMGIPAAFPHQCGHHWCLHNIQRERLVKEKKDTVNNIIRGTDWTFFWFLVERNQNQPTNIGVWKTLHLSGWVEAGCTASTALYQPHEKGKTLDMGVASVMFI